MTKLSLVLAAALCAPCASFGQEITGPGDAPIQTLNRPGGPATQFLTSNPAWQALTNQQGALLFTDTKTKHGAVLGNVTHQDPAGGLWVQNDPTLSSTSNGWRIDGTANQTLVQKSGSALHVVTQTYTDYASKHNSVLAVTFPALTYSSGFRFNFTQSGLPWTLVFDQAGSFRIEAVVAKKQGPAVYSFPVTSSEPLTVDPAGELFGNTHAGLTRAVMIPRFGKAIPCSAWSYSKAGVGSFTCDDSALQANQFPYRIDPQSQLTLTDSTDSFNISNWCSYDPTWGGYDCGSNDAHVSFDFSPYIQPSATGIQLSCGFNVSDSDMDFLSDGVDSGTPDGDTVACSVSGPVNDVTVDLTVVTTDDNPSTATNCCFWMAYSDTATLTDVNATAYWTAPAAASAPTFNGWSGQWEQNPAQASGPFALTLASSPGASIRYTTDGSTPTDTHGNYYSGPITINAPTYVIALAYGNGYGDSPTAGAAWNMDVAAPTFAPVAGLYTSATVTLSPPGNSYSASASPIIYYTTDGSTPLQSSNGTIYGTLYAGPFSLPGNATTTVKAVSAVGPFYYYGPYWLWSSVASATYTITGTVSAPSFSLPGGTYSSGPSVSLSDATSGTTIVYTTDGSTPTQTHGTVYSGAPISFSFSTTIKALAYKTNWASSSSSATYTIVYPGAPITGSGNGVTNGTAASDSGNGLDPRRAGVRALGAYWGASGENIDTTSANLNFSTPLIKPMSRGSWSIPFMLSYNSQMWRHDSGGTWLLGEDTGYGMGWKLQAGSITPIWTSPMQFSHYIYTDATGAEYSLSVSNNNVWTSQEGVYVSYDATANRLYSTDGSFWYMGCQSSGGEQDAGTLYPTLIEDTNGNQIAITYQAGAGSGAANSSARISNIADPRAPNGSGTYIFTYHNTGTIPHLTSITANIFLPGETWQFSYSTITLTDPFAGASYGTTALLAGVQPYAYAGGGPPASSYTYNNSAELTQYATPLGGSLSWVYQPFTYNGGITVREVTSRGMNDAAANNFTNSWTLTHPSSDSSLTYHSSTAILDSGAASQKVYGSGIPISGSSLVVPTGYAEENAAGSTVLLQKSFTWTRDSAGNAYVGTVTSTLNGGTGSPATSSTVQTLDIYGNLQQQILYDYSSATTPYRTYNFSYLTSSNYTSIYIRNRMTSANATGYGGGVVLAENSYDGTGLGALLDPSALSQGTPSMHDSNYDVSVTSRGNPTTVYQGGTTTNMAYLTTGVPYEMSDGAGMVVSVATNGSTAYSLPSALTPNSNGNLATSMTYSESFALVSVTGANGATQSILYDAYNRSASATSVDGAVTNYSYTYLPNTQTATISTTTNGTTTTQWKTTTFDGFGRPIRVQTGNNGTAVTNVDTQYGACGCSPLGKMTATSMPYAAGGSPSWIAYTYDASGRTLTQTKPDASQTKTSYNANSVLVTDPAGKFKSYVYDAAGGLETVSEPDPATGAWGPVTYYWHNAAGQIVQVSVQRNGVGQQRNYSWSGTDLISSTDPETGTTTYQYDGNHHVVQRIDAKNQQTKYTYDAYERLIEVQHYAPPTCQYCQPAEQVNQRVLYTYDVNPLDPGNYTNSWGRLTGVSFQQQTGEGPVFDDLFAYYYSYNQAGRVTTNTFQATSPDGSTMLANLAANYAWDTQGRMTNMTYPSGPQLTYQYDAMGRLSGITSPNVASLYQSVSATYTGAGQLSTLSYGTSYYGPVNVETRSYNSLMQLTRMTTVGSQTAMDMIYNYTAGHNNGRVASTTDNVLGETVNYMYDYWNRLTSAAATNGSWGDSYTYDGFGNLTGKTPTAGTAPALSVPSNLNTNQAAGTAYDANGNPSPVNPVTGIAGYTWDVENRLVNVGGNVVGTVNYSYDPWGRRIWKEIPGTQGAASTGEIYFYGVPGQKLETYSFSYGTSFSASLEGINVYFGGKLLQSKGNWVATDKLGTVRWNAGLGAINYWPYGEERTSTANGVEKFGTYTRDAVGQDYAQQRYYSASTGAFWTPDPGGITTANPKNPSSWNRYAYVLGDPVNHSDRRGLYVDAEDCANNPDECSNCLPGTAFWGQPPGCDDDDGGGSSDAGDSSTSTDSEGPSCGNANIQAFVTANFDAAAAAASALKIGGAVGDADVLTLSAMESGFGGFAGGFPGAWFGMQGVVGVPLYSGETSCAAIQGTSKYCEMEFSTFQAAANVFVQNKGSLVGGVSNPAQFFTILHTKKGGFAQGTPLQTYLHGISGKGGAVRLDQRVQNCITILGLAQ